MISSHRLFFSDAIVSLAPSQSVSHQIGIKACVQKFQKVPTTNPSLKCELYFNTTNYWVIGSKFFIFSNHVLCFSRSWIKGSLNSHRSLNKKYQIQIPPLWTLSHCQQMAGTTACQDENPDPSWSSWEHLEAIPHLRSLLTLVLSTRTQYFSSVARTFERLDHGTVGPACDVGWPSGQGGRRAGSHSQITDVAPLQTGEPIYQSRNTYGRNKFKMQN